MIRALAFSLVLILMPAQAYETNFSCAIGKRAACLDYGDKVCSSFAKCVADDAVCFDAYTCGFGGFVCKSKLDDVVNRYDDLSRTCRSLSYDHDALVSKYNNLLADLDMAQDRLDSVRRCITRATSLEAAQMCR